MRFYSLNKPDYLNPIKDTDITYANIHNKYEFPLRLEGIENLPKKKEGFLFEQILGNAQISSDWILNHL